MAEHGSRLGVVRPSLRIAPSLNVSLKLFENFDGRLMRKTKARVVLMGEF